VRRHATLVAVALLLVSVAACGSSDGGVDRPTPTTTTAVSTATAPETTSTTATASSSTTAATATTRPTPTTPAPTTTVPATGSGSLAGRTVVIDPGHNGGNFSHTAEINTMVDAGGFQKACNTTGTATDGGYRETMFNWAGAVQLASRLRAMGATVILTRDSDTGWGPCIDERGGIADEADADALVSIHADGAAAGEHGFHVIRPGPVPGYTDGIVEPSSQLATRTRDTLVAAGLTPATYVGGGGIVARTDLGTLNLARVPAVMLEAGNMRNAADAALLQSPAGQAAIAEALASAVAAQLASHASRNP